MYEGVEWDDPRWHVTRLLVDLMSPRYRPLGANEIIPYLDTANPTVGPALAGYLASREYLLEPVAEHLQLRLDAEKELTVHLRTEGDAIQDLQRLGEIEVATYGTQSADHHQSAKAMVQTIETITRLECDRRGIAANTNPQSRAVTVDDRWLWVSPRRLDGALPGLINPVGIWEIKEYWGTTKGGSKMSDAIYEIHLVGMELRTFEREHGVHVNHYAILDGAQQWSHRRSDLRRAADLLFMGLIDELIVGDEAMEEWPIIVHAMCDLLE